MKHKSTDSEGASYIKEKMAERGILYVRDLAKQVGIPFAKFRQYLWTRRFPLTCLDQIKKSLSVSEEDLRSHGLTFEDIKPRRKLGHTLSHKVNDAQLDVQIFPLLKAIADSGVESCTLSELCKIIEFQSSLAKPINKDLAKCLLTNMRS